MSRRYKKIKEDMPLLAAKIEDDTPTAGGKPSGNTNVIYLLLSTSNSFYLHGKRSSQNLSYIAFFQLSVSKDTKK